MRMVSRIGALGLVLLSMIGCSRLLAKPLGEVGQLVTVEGQVISMDTSPMAYDGPAEVELENVDHGRILLLVQPCFGGCSPEAVDALGVIEVGQTWQAQGEILAGGEVGIFKPEVHWLQPASGS